MRELPLTKVTFWRTCQICNATRSRRAVVVGYTLSGTHVEVSRVTIEVSQVNPLKPRDNCMYHLLYQSVTLHFVFVGFI
jgi:hypothetical protein